MRVKELTGPKAVKLWAYGKAQPLVYRDSNSSEFGIESRE